MKQVAAELVLSTETVRRDLDRGAPHSRKGNRILLNVGEYAAWRKSNGLTGERGRPCDPDLKAARVRKELALADRYEMENAKIRGELLDADAVAREWTQVGITVRNSMESMTNQIVPLALSAGMPQESAPAFSGKLDELINGVLRHLATTGTATVNKALNTTTEDPACAES